MTHVASRRALVVIGTVVLCLIPLSFALWKMYRRPRTLIGRSVAGEQMMPNGTLLVLEQAIFGKKHEFEYTPPDKSGLPAWLPGRTKPEQVKQPVAINPQHEAVVVWLTRWNLATLDRQLRDGVSSGRDLSAVTAKSWATALTPPPATHAPIIGCSRRQSSRNCHLCRLPPDLC